MSIGGACHGNSICPSNLQVMKFSEIVGPTVVVGVQTSPF